MRAACRSLLGRAANPAWRFRAALTGLLLGLAVALVAFEEVVDDVFDDIPAGDLEAQRLDDAFFACFRAVRGPMLTQVMTDLTALGSISVLMLVSILILGALAFARDGFRALHYLCVGIGAASIPLLLKQYFDRPRPDPAERLIAVGELSFPSGHAFGAAAIYLFVALWVWRWRMHAAARMCASLFALCLIGCVGTSRIYLGVHYATDVMAGLAAGAAWTLGVAIVFLLIEQRRRRV